MAKINAETEIEKDITWKLKFEYMIEACVMILLPLSIAVFILIVIIKIICFFLVSKT